MIWSKKLSVNKSDYILEGVISINSSYYDAIDELINRKNSKNNIFGEFGEPERFEISLTNVCHLITDIKLNKVFNTLSVKCKVLDTPRGKVLKNIIDDGIDDGLRMCIRGSKSNNRITKIFTIDIDLPIPTPEDILRQERREKLDKINERT